MSIKTFTWALIYNINIKFFILRSFFMEEKFMQVLEKIQRGDSKRML